MADEQTAWCADRDGVRQLEIPHDLLIAAPTQKAQSLSDRLIQLIEPFVLLGVAFRQLIQSGIPAGENDHLSQPSPATFQDGLHAMMVLDAMRESDRTGGALPVDRLSR